MEIFKIAAFGIVSAMIAITLRKQNPEISASVGIACGITVILLLANSFSAIINEFNLIIDKSGIPIQYFKTVVKIIGISYISKFTAEICRDGGENAIASKIEFGGKITLLSVTMPIIGDFLNLIIDTLGEF